MNESDLCCVSRDSFKFLARRRLWVKSGRDAAEIMRTIVFDFHDVETDISFNEDAIDLDNAIAAYFSAVAMFKSDNDYKDGDFINATKICAFTIVTLSSRNLDAFFRFESDKMRIAYLSITCWIFVYLFTCSALALDLENIPPDMERDFFVCLKERRQVDPYWLSWALRAFLDAYKGKPVSTTMPALPPTKSAPKRAGWLSWLWA